MTYYKNLKKFKFKPAKAGKYELMVNVMDSEGNFRNYPLKIEVIFDEEDLEKEAEEMKKLVESAKAGGADLEEAENPENDPDYVSEEDMNAMGDFFSDMAANRGPVDPNRVPFTIAISDITSNGEV
jgi:hypothetical protein